MMSYCAGAAGIAADAGCNQAPELAACATLPPAVFAGVEEALAARPNVQPPSNPSASASPSVGAAPAAHTGEDFHHVYDIT